jgi:Kef-type K+ transport system membrane component KefB
MKSDVYRILAWSVCLPVLVVWPFLSAMPALSLSGDGLSVPATSLYAMLLLTGFWPIAATYAAYRYVRNNSSTNVRRTGSRRGLLLGAYAMVWTGSYLAITLMNS